MDYVATAIRFEFFNGVKNYTVEYSPVLNRWYIFKDRETSNCLKWYPVKPKEVINENNAWFYLNKYLNKL